MRIIGFIVLGLVFVGLLAGGFWMIAPAFQKSAKPRMIMAEIRLDNRCEVDDRAFAVQVVETGVVMAFTEGRARLPLRSDRKVRLIANPAFPDVTYEGSDFPVAEKLALIASCGVSDRLQNVFSAFGTQFKK